MHLFPNPAFLLLHASLLTFVFVAFGFNAENCHDHDDDDDGGGSQSDEEPRLAVERLRLKIAEFEVALRRGCDLQRFTQTLDCSFSTRFFRAEVGFQFQTVRAFPQVRNSFDAKFLPFSNSGGGGVYAKVSRRKVYAFVCNVPATIKYVFSLSRGSVMQEDKTEQERAFHLPIPLSFMRRSRLRACKILPRQARLLLWPNFSRITAVRTSRARPCKAR